MNEQTKQKKTLTIDQQIAAAEEKLREQLRGVKQTRARIAKLRDQKTLADAKANAQKVSEQAAEIAKLREQLARFAKSGQAQQTTQQKATQKPADDGTIRMQGVPM